MVTHSLIVNQLILYAKTNLRMIQATSKEKDGEGGMVKILIGSNVTILPKFS